MLQEFAPERQDNWKAKMKAKLVLFGMLAVGISGAASAIPTTWTFAGEMTDGTAFSGSLTFDTDRPDRNTSDRRGGFVFVDSLDADLELEMGGALARASRTHADGRHADFLAEGELFDDLDSDGDLLRFIFNVSLSPAPAIETLQEFNVDLFFVDESGAWLSEAILPFNAPALSALSLDPNVVGWGDRFNLQSPAVLRFATVSSLAGQQFQYGAITSLTTVTVPEPYTLTLLALGFIGLVVSGRWQAVFDHRAR